MTPSCALFVPSRRAYHPRYVRHSHSLSQPHSHPRCDPFYHPHAHHYYHPYCQPQEILGRFPQHERAEVFQWLLVSSSPSCRAMLASNTAKLLASVREPNWMVHQLFHTTRNGGTSDGDLSLRLEGASYGAQWRWLRRLRLAALYGHRARIICAVGVVVAYVPQDIHNFVGHSRSFSPLQLRLPTTDTAFDQMEECVNGQRTSPSSHLGSPSSHLGDDGQRTSPSSHLGSPSSHLQYHDGQSSLPSSHLGMDTGTCANSRCASSSFDSGLPTHIPHACIPCTSQPSPHLSS